MTSIFVQLQEVNEILRTRIMKEEAENERLQGIVSKTEQWASYLHSCAMSGELPLTRKDFDVESEKVEEKESDV